MSKQPTITTIATGFYSTSALNTNFENIRDQFDNTLSLDGSTPNAMTADFDLNSQDLLNGNYVYTQRLYLGGIRVTAPEANITWDGEWVTATSYSVDHLVGNDGNVYICLVAHTSGTFSTDLSSAYWELFTAKGTDAGTGALLAANNLSDVANSDTALANLGGGTVGIAIFKDTTAGAVRTELSAQEQDDILDDLAGLTQATNKVPYFDSATTAATLSLETTATDSDTSIPTSGAVVDAVSYAFISSVDASNDANINFTGFDASSYDSYEFVLMNVVPATDSVGLHVLTSSDGGSSYDTGASDYSWDSIVQGGGHMTTTGDTADTEFQLTGGDKLLGSSTSEYGVSGKLTIYGPHLTGYTFMSFDGLLVDNGGIMRRLIASCARRSAADVDGLRFVMSSGNLESGTISMYGLRNS